MVSLHSGVAGKDLPAITPMTLVECERQTRQLLNDMNAAEFKLFHDLNELFYKSTAIIREVGETEPDKTAHSRLLMAASAPVLLVMEPFLKETLKDAENQIMLGLLGYPGRFRKLIFNREIARGYMTERIILSGNVWEKPHHELEWLGANVLSFAHLSGELQKRNTVDREAIETMMVSSLALSEGTL